MSKRFVCPNCNKHDIELVQEGFTRVSNVIKVLTEEKVEQSFLCSLSSVLPPPQPISSYRCTDCKHVLGSSIAFIRDKFFIEEGEKIHPTTTYKIKQISHCSGDSPTVREHTDLINLIIRFGGGEITTVYDNSKDQITTQKLIRERPYLFTRKY